jgi:hypothetical protein
LSSVSQNVLNFYQLFSGEERRIPFIFDHSHFCRSRVIGLDMTENRIFTLCRLITYILRNTTQVILRHRVKILFSMISSPITLERQKWKSSKMKFLRMFWHLFSHLPVKRGGSLSFLTIFTFAVPEFLDLIWWKIGFLPYGNITQVIIRHRVKILFSVISSPITLEWQKWKSSKLKGIFLFSLVSCW